jgi:hypothetical protein
MVFAIQSELKAFDKLFKIKEGDGFSRLCSLEVGVSRRSVVRQHGTLGKSVSCRKFDSDKLHKLMVKRWI